MKKILILIFLTILAVSCGDNAKKTKDGEKIKITVVQKTVLLSILKLSAKMSKAIFIQGQNRIAEECIMRR